MNKTVNLILLETKQKIIKVLNESGMPISISRLILQDIYDDVAKQAEEITIQEANAYNQSLQQEAEKAKQKAEKQVTSEIPKDEKVIGIPKPKEKK